MAEIPWKMGLDYGVGVDSLTGDQRGDAVVRPAPETVPGADGQTTTFRLEMVDSLDSLETLLDVSVRAKGGYLGVGGGSAKFDFVQRSSYNEYSLFLLVHVSVTNAYRQMRDVALKPQAYELLKQGKVDRFRQQYGDMFVDGVLTGGEYVAVLQIHTKDQSDYESTSAKIKGGASFGLASFSASAAFNKTVNEVSQDHSIVVDSFQQGGDTTPAKDVDAIIAKAISFPASVVRDRAVPYMVSVTDYTDCDMPDMPNWVDLQNAREVLEDTFAKKSALATMRNNIDYILGHAGEFEPFDGSRLNAARKSLNDQINTMVRNASRCAGNVMSCKFPDYEVPLAAQALPKRKGAQPSRPLMVLNPGVLRAIINAKRAPAKPPIIRLPPPAGRIVLRAPH